MVETLKECLDRHGSDKAWRHHYHLIYEPIFAPVRDEPLAILEVGVWRGGSVRAWREWFPHASITGLDIFKRKPMKPIPGVAQIEGNSTNPPPLGSFDIIIDDGCHFPLIQAQTLKALWPMLNPGGTYFLEDVWKPDPKHPWTRGHSDQYQPQNYERLDAEIQATAGSAEVHDLRELSGELDSCVYVMRKP
jgi:hypothetical protein